MAPVLKRANPTDGVNLVDEPASIAPTQAQWLKNVWPSKPGVISLRPSMEPVVRSGPVIFTSVLNLVPLTQPMLGAMFMVVGEVPTMTSTEVRIKLLNVADDSFDWYYSTLHELVSQALTTAVWGRGSFVLIDDVWYFFDGYTSGWTISAARREFYYPTRILGTGLHAYVEAGVHKIGPLASRLNTYGYEDNSFRYPGASDVGGSWPNLPADWRPRIAVYTRERLVLFNLADTCQDGMIWSDKNNPMVFDADYDANGSTDGVLDATVDHLLDVDGPTVRLGGDNVELTAALVVSTSNQENLANEAILVFKRDKAFLALGEPGQTSDVDDPDGSLTVTELSVRAGCVGSQACCTSPYGAWWVGPDEVWFMPYGNLPMRMGTKISPRLKAQASSDGWKTQCVYANGRLVITLSSGGSGSTSAMDEQWWLDLRRGPPESWKDARWFGPQVHAPAGPTEAGVHFLGAVDGEHLAALAVDMRGTQVLSLVSLDGDSGEDHVSSVGYSRPWQPLTDYSVGDEIYPIGTASDVVTYPFTSDAFSQSPWRYICITAGKSGATIPAFNVSSPITDGTAVWNFTWSAQPASTANSPVLMDVLSREENLGDPSLQKTFDGVELAHSLGAPMAVSVISLGSERNVAPERATEDVKPSATGPIIMDDGVSGGFETQLAVRSGGARFLPASSSGVKQVSRPPSFRFKTLAKYVLGRDRYFACSFWSTASLLGGDTFCIARVPAGIYDTLEDLVEELNAALVNAIDGSPYGNYTWMLSSEGFQFCVTLRDGVQDESRAGTLLPYAALCLKGNTIADPTGIYPTEVTVPLVTSPTTGFFVGASPVEWSSSLGYVDPATGETIGTVYEDTTYLMNLFGLALRPGSTENGYYIRAGYNATGVEWATHKQRFGTAPYSMYRKYPRFDIFDMNFRLRTFAKRPT